MPKASPKPASPDAAGQALRRALRGALRAEANAEKAGPMQRYMKSDMPYYGIPTVPLRAICKQVFKAHALPSAGAWQSCILELFRGAKFREERYAALALAGYAKYKAYRTLDALPVYEELIVTGAWWDIVDDVASHRIGELLRNHPSAMRRTLLRWARGDDMWKRRSAIIAQLSFKEETDLELLYACIEPSLGSREFFLCKAIGWALRSYAWTDPAEVEGYVRANAARLSGLSQREALKNIGRKRATRAK